MPVVSCNLEKLSSLVYGLLVCSRISGGSRGGARSGGHRLHLPAAPYFQCSSPLCLLGNLNKPCFKRVFLAHGLSLDLAQPAVRTTRRRVCGAHVCTKTYANLMRGAPPSGPTWRLQRARGQDARGALDRPQGLGSQRGRRGAPPQKRVWLAQVVRPAGRHPRLSSVCLSSCTVAAMYPHQG